MCIKEEDIVFIGIEISNFIKISNLQLFMREVGYFM